VRINRKEIEWKRLALSVSRWGPIKDSFDIPTNIQVFLTYGEYWRAPYALIQYSRFTAVRKKIEN
jgi:hypothetical protein